MNSLRVVLTTLLLAAALSGCSVHVVSPVADTGKIRTVAVVSAVHDTLTMQYDALFSGNRYTVPVDWGIRKRLEDRLSAALAPHYEIRRLNEDLTPAIADASAPFRDNGFNGGEDAVLNTVKSTVKPGQVDAIIVVYDRAGAIYKYASVGNSGDFPYYVGLIYRIMVLDGRTFALIGNDYGSIPRANPVLFDYDNAAVDIDIGWRGENYDKVPPSTKETIRAALYDLVDRSAPFTLRNRLHLIP